MKEKKLIKAIKNMVSKYEELTGDKIEYVHYHNPYDLIAHGGIKPKQ